MPNLPPEKRKEYQLNRYHSRRAKFVKHLGGKCNSCGSTEDLEFDHIDPDTKSFAIGTHLVSASISELEEEIDKCQLLCRPCHIEKSRSELQGRIPWNKGKGGGHGTYAMAYPVSKCSCDKCETYREERRKSRRKN